MSRQYFGDVLTEPVNASYPTITAITETNLIPTALCPIAANEPRAGKFYELMVGGTFTSGASGTMTITPRFDLTVGGISLGASPAQTYVPSITNAPFLYRCQLAFRSIGLPGVNSLVVCSGKWESGGAIATAASQSSIQHCTTGAAVSVDVSVASGLWIGITCSVAPSIIPQWHLWRSLN
jgi:hypothetical protein